VFGSYRFALASLVVLSHLAGELNAWAGGYAVFAFYVLSGYLMSLVLDRVYLQRPGGTWRFLGNRWLRIYPPYYAVLLLSLAIVALAPVAAVSTNPALRLPENASQAAANFGIFGLMYGEARLVPTAWSLDVELFFYLFMLLVMGRRAPVAALWLAASVLWALYLVMSGADFGDRYTPYDAAALPFALGACGWHFGRRIPLSGTAHAVLAPTLFFANVLLAGRLWGDVYVGGFYVSLLAAGYVTLALARRRSDDAPPWLAQLDRRLGDLSYPLFLCHWPLAALVHGVTGLGPGAGLLALTWPVSVAVSAGLHALVETPVERLRDAVRAVRRRPLPGPAA
jgi:peptidoglycan/LPS O-acetylase OafA/YrhL